ncbi:glycosyltransferase family 39 protein [candidate division WOR-3 bacterium]|nr:glycosyltransferase family 39 protein [candidate division WOR-3 bacterium]
MSSRNLLVVIFLITICIRIPVVVLSGDKVLEHEFNVLVHNLRAGNGYSFFTIDHSRQISQNITIDPVKALPTATIPPVYPLFLTVMYAVIGDTVHTIQWIEIVQVVLSGLCCLFVYQIVRMKFSEPTALVSSVLFALYPILVYLPGQISSANPYIFLNCLLLYCLFRGEQKRTVLPFVFSGIVFGLLVLARAEAIAYIPFIVLWMIIVVKEHAGQRILAFTIMAMVVMAPWVYRNYRVFNAFVPLTTQGGYNLWQGQNPDATGTRSQYTDPPFHVSAEVEQEILALPATDQYELTLQDIYMREAKQFIKNNPGRVITLGLRKCMFYWGYYWGIDFTYPGGRSFLYWLPWFLILPFFIIGIVSSLRTAKRYSLFYIYFIVSTLIVMTFFVIPRYRLFILPLIFPFAVVGCIAVWRRVHVFLTNKNTA